MSLLAAHSAFTVQAAAQYGKAIRVGNPEQV